MNRTLCPLCNFSYNDILCNINCGNFDNSYLYKDVNVIKCKKCGHIFNLLNKYDVINLKKYYEKEYAPINITSKNDNVDRPGEINPKNVKRYHNIYNLISKLIKKESRILDIGCAMGGFLDYIASQGFINLYGIDMCEEYIQIAQLKPYINFKIGCAEKIPFESNFFDVVILDQVLEHLHNPRKVLKEIRRVLAKNGILCIGVPNALQYNSNYIYDYYWFLMREHIQHFDITHLDLLIKSESFRLITYTTVNTPMLSDNKLLPDLITVCQVSNKNVTNFKKEKNLFNLADEIKMYLEEESKRLLNKKKLLLEFIKFQEPILVWGIGREFLYLYENAGLKKCNIIALIDNNQFKQRSLCVNGMKINEPSVLSEYREKKYTLLITATAHVDSIKNKVKDIGYHGQVITLE